MIKIYQLDQGTQQILTTSITFLEMKLYFSKIIGTLLVHGSISSVYGMLQKKIIIIK